MFNLVVWPAAQLAAEIWAALFSTMAFMCVITCNPQLGRTFPSRRAPSIPREIFCWHCLKPPGALKFGDLSEMKCNFFLHPLTRNPSKFMKFRN